MMTKITKYNSNGKWHCDSGPAYKNRFITEYWLNGKRHRIDGPAVIWNDGRKSWWINNHHVTYKIQEWANEMNIDLDNLTDEDKMMIRIYWENYDGK